MKPMEFLYKIILYMSKMVVKEEPATIMTRKGIRRAFVT
jgi:hypothetical protein